MAPQDQDIHPTPWRVEYWRRCEEWNPRSCPRVVDADGRIVVEIPQSVGHPGEYDAQADATANRITEAVNSFPVIAWTEQKSIKAGAYYVRRKGSKIRPYIVELDGDPSEGYWDDGREFAGPLPKPPE